MSRTYQTEMSERKPTNYFNELSPEQQEAHRSLDVMAAKTEEYRKIGEAVNAFESFQRWLDNADPSFEEEKERPIPKANPMPPLRRRRRTGEMLLEEVMFRRGLLQEA